MELKRAPPALSWGALQCLATWKCRSGIALWNHWHSWGSWWSGWFGWYSGDFCLLTLPSENSLYFRLSFVFLHLALDRDLVSNSILSQDIPTRLSGFYIRIWDHMDSEDYFSSFTHFSVLFWLQAVFSVFPFLSSFVLHSPRTANLKSWSWSLLMSQPNWERQLFVLGASQSVGCNPNPKFKHMLFTECFHTVKLQLQFKTASLKHWRKWIIPGSFRVDGGCCNESYRHEDFLFFQAVWECLWFLNTEAWILLKISKINPPLLMQLLWGRRHVCL